MNQPHHEASPLEAHGITNVARVYWNQSVPALYEEAVRRREALISASGPLVCRTGQHTGRSPNDKFIVREPSSERHVWWGKVNRGIDEAHFDAPGHRREAEVVRRAVGQASPDDHPDAQVSLPLPAGFYGSSVCTVFFLLLGRQPRAQSASSF